MKNLVYPALFKEEDGGFVVTFPDLPGCITEGDTIEEAYKYAKEALALFLDDMKEKPKPSAVKDIKAVNNNLVMLVEADDADDIEYFKKSDIPKYIDNALVQKGYTKYQVAQILGVDKSYITRISKGERIPSVDMAKRIAALLSIDWRVFYAQ